MDNNTDPNDPQTKESTTAEEEFNEIASNEGQGDTDDSGNEKDSTPILDGNHREIETNPTIFSTEGNSNTSENTQTNPTNQNENENDTIGSHAKINPEDINNLGNQLLDIQQPVQPNNEQNQPTTNLETPSTQNSTENPVQSNSQLSVDAQSNEQKNENIDTQISQPNEISNQEPSIESKNQTSIENIQTEEKLNIASPNAILQDTSNILINTLTNQNENSETNQQQNEKFNDDTKLDEQELNENEIKTELTQNEINDSNKIEENQENENQSTNNVNQIEDPISENQNKINTTNQNQTENSNQNDNNKSGVNTIDSTNINPIENENENQNQNEISNQNENEVNSNELVKNQNSNQNEINQNEVNSNELVKNENQNKINQNEFVKNENDVNDIEQKVLGDDSTFFTSNKQFMNEPNAIHEPQSKPQQRPRKKVKLTQEEYHKLRIEKLKEYALQMYPLDDPSFETTNDEFEEIIRILINDREKQVSNRHFIESNRINEALVKVNTCYENKQKKELQQQEYNKYLESVKKYEQELERFDKETYEMIEQVDERNIESLKEMRKRHDDEIDEHYIKWMSDSKLRQYNRASQTLIGNRKTLELLLSQNRYVEAHNMQNAIYNLERKEEQVAMKQRQHDYDESLKMLTDKQKNEEDFLIQKCEIKKDQLIKRRQVERTMFVNKEKKIEAMKKEAEDPEKVWNSMQVQRINEIYKKKPGNKMMSRDLAKKRKNNQGVVLPPITDNDNIPRTARQPPTLTVLKLPPLKIKKPIRKSNTFVHSSR